jgi:hypothetical protein
MLNNLDKYIETELIPVYTQGQRRKTYPPYVTMTRDAFEARKAGDWKRALKLSKQAQQMPSRDPNDPNFRRLWYFRYAGDFLLGFTGSKTEALEIKTKIHEYLQQHLKLKLSEEKTLITHAKTQKAKFLGYEIHALHENSKHDNRGQRCINGGLGFLIPASVRKEKCARYMDHGKPRHLPQRTIDHTYSIVSEYQAEYRGIVQYYKMAYNLHTLSKLKHIMEVSLVKTLASKYKLLVQKFINGMVLP